jgi:hypothetical protein
MKNYNHTAAKIYKACKRHARQVKKNLHIFEAEQARPTTRKIIGKNEDGAEIYEDERGARSIKRAGFLICEPVKMHLTPEGNYIAIPRTEHDPAFTPITTAAETTEQDEATPCNGVATGEDEAAQAERPTVDELRGGIAARAAQAQKRTANKAAATQDGKPTQNAQDDGNAPPAAADGLERPSTFYAAAQDGGQGEDTTPSEDPEKELRKSWTAQGISQERQDEIIAQITAAAQPGAMVGPFRIPTEEERKKMQEARAAEAAEDADGRPTIEQLRRQYGGRIEQEFGWKAMQKRARMTRRRARAMAAAELRAEEKRAQEEKKARAEYEAERRAAGYTLAQDGRVAENAAMTQA